MPLRHLIILIADVHPEMFIRQHSGRGGTRRPPGRERPVSRDQASRVRLGTTNIWQRCGAPLPHTVKDGIWFNLLFTMTLDQALPKTMSCNNANCCFYSGFGFLPISVRREWWSWTGSNRRPEACKATALPTELQPRYLKTLMSAISAEWWAWVDSNYRPHPYQGCALTT